MQGYTSDGVGQPKLVANCTLKTEVTSTALGENHALTLATNAAVEKGGNVLLIPSNSMRDAFTTEVHGKIYGRAPAHDKCHPSQHCQKLQQECIGTERFLTLCLAGVSGGDP